MRLVHWNVHHSGIGSDNKLNTPRLAEVLKSLNPDVVTMNEVEQFNGYGNQDTVNIICHILGPEWSGHFVNVSGTVNSNGQGNAILCKSLFSSPIGKGLVKGRCMAAVTLNKTLIVTTHLSNTSANDREVQAAQVVYHDAVHSASRVLIAGDWNAHEGNVELSSLYAWFKDAWHAVKGTSFDNTGGTHNHSRIDMVFSKGVTIKAIDIPDSRIDGVFASDHNPVVVDFE